MLKSFNYNIIDEYQIEITTYCNAACPQCPRNNNGSGVNPYLKLEHLPRGVIDQAFPKELCNRLRQIFFCGSYGDPIMHPDFLDILRDFRQKCPTLWLYIHTIPFAFNRSSHVSLPLHLVSLYLQARHLFNNFDGLDSNASIC